MINILELESSKGWGGQEKRTVRLVNSLDKKNFKIFWGVQKESKLLDLANTINATFFEISMRQSFDIIGLFQIIKIIRKNNIDIIATHSGKDAWLGALAGFLTNTKVVRTRHLQTPINSPKSYNLSTKVVTVSKQVSQYLESVGVKKEKLCTIYTGIDTSLYHPSTNKRLHEELNLGKNTLLIGIVAVLRKAKRHIDLIDAFVSIDSHESIALIIIGTGPHEDFLQSYVRALNLPQNKSIYFLGHRDDISTILSSLDIFVLPSNMEALGTAILEASACAVPSIGSRVGGIPECILDQQTGLLFEKENVYDLKSKLEYLINNPKIRVQYGVNARNLIIEHFSVEHMTQETEKLYKELSNE